MWGKEGVLFRDCGGRGCTVPSFNYDVHSVRRCVSEMVSVVWLLSHVRLRDPIDCSQTAGAGCHFLLQGIFPTPGSNPGLLHCRQIRYHLSHQGRPKPTALDLPRQSPIQVLIRPDPAELPRSDEIRCVQGGIAIAELPGNPYNSQGSNNSFHNCLKEIII